MLSTSLKYILLRRFFPRLNYSAAMGSIITLLLALTFCSDWLLLRLVTVLRNVLPVEDSLFDFILGWYFMDRYRIIDLRSVMHYSMLRSMCY